MSEIRIIRGRQEAASSAVRRLADSHSQASEVALVQTKIATDYPTVASAYYACAPLRVDGPETEGAAVTFTGDSSRTIMAFNLGSKAPPVGTKLLIHSSGGCWAFRYDG